MRIEPIPHRRLHPDDHALPALPASARVFAVGEGGVRLVTLPGDGPLKVLVPRGHGWPLLGTKLGESLRGAQHGEACSPARWGVAGMVALHVVDVDLPRGPAPAAEAPRPAGAGAWIALRLYNLPWSAARLRDPAVGHGLVAVVNARVVTGVSPAARDAGVARGMSPALARRRCPRLKLAAPADAGALAAAVEGWLVDQFPGAIRGRTWLLPVAAPPTTSAGLVLVDGLLRQLWQRFGVEAGAVIASEAGAARVAAGWLGPRRVAAVPGGADRVVVAEGRAGGTARPRGRAWAGPARPDVEGVVEVVRALAAGVDRDVVVRLHAERGLVRVPVGVRTRNGVPEVERAVRTALLGVGAVRRVGLVLRAPRRPRASPAPVPPPVERVRQLALLPGLR